MLSLNWVITVRPADIRHPMIHVAAHRRKHQKVRRYLLQGLNHYAHTQLPWKQSLLLVAQKLRREGRGGFSVERTRDTSSTMLSPNGFGIILAFIKSYGRTFATLITMPRRNFNDSKRSSKHFLECEEHSLTSEISRACPSIQHYLWSPPYSYL